MAKWKERLMNAAKKTALVSGTNYLTQSTRAAAPKKPEQHKFSIEWVEIDSINLWEDNPRINTKAVNNLVAIIKDHGIKSPIVCWDKNRVIYKGNTTYKACQKLGMTHVPAVFHHFESETAAKAYGIADNKAGENSSWDKAILVEMLRAPEFKKLNKNIGYTEQQFDVLISDEQQTASGIVREQHSGLIFKAVVEVQQSEFKPLLEELKKIVAKFKTARIA
jgi:hypothetical protein